MSSFITTLLIGIFVIPSLLIIIIPLLDKILNQGFLDLFNSSLVNLNIMIGSNQTNYILIIIGVIMFLVVFRFILRSMSLFSK